MQREVCGSSCKSLSCWPGDPVFQRDGQTCRAALVWVGVDRGEDSAHLWAGDGDLGQLEGDGAGMADHAGSNLNQFELQTDTDDVTVLLCGSSQTHLGTLMPSGGGHIIRATGRTSTWVPRLERNVRGYRKRAAQGLGGR